MLVMPLVIVFEKYVTDFSRWVEQIVFIWFTDCVFNTAEANGLKKDGEGIIF